MSKAPVRLREIRIRGIELRLLHLRTREEQLSGEIDCWELEEILEYIAERAGAGKRLFHGCSNTFDWDFSAEQRKILFSLLLQIEEKIHWKPDPHG